MSKQRETKLEILPWVWPLVGNVLLQKWRGRVPLSLFSLAGSALDVFFWVHGSVLLALGTVFLLCAVICPLLLSPSKWGRKPDGFDLLIQTFLLAGLSLALGGLGFFIILFGLLLH